MAIYAPWLPTLGDQGSHADWKKSQELLSPLDHWIPGFRWLHPHFCCLKSYHISFHPPLIWATSALCCLPANFFRFCSSILFFAQPVQCVLQRLVAIPQSTRTVLWWKTTFCAAFTKRLATSSCSSNPACQELHSITHFLLRAAVPMRFVTGWKPA